jgi:hypothetical protein
MLCAAAASPAGSSMAASGCIATAGRVKKGERHMRMLLKVSLPTSAYNRAIADGKLGSVWSAAFRECPPEATYYLNENGCRAVYSIIDVQSPDQLAAISMPLYEHFEADVSFVPAMVFAELQQAINRMEKI